jgi:hypothetical protein
LIAAQNAIAAAAAADPWLRYPLPRRRRNGLPAIERDATRVVTEADGSRRSIARKEKSVVVASRSGPTAQTAPTRSPAARSTVWPGG